MLRPALLLATVGLCGLTALALLGLGLTLRPPSTLAVDAEADAASREVVIRFYDAVNLAIATGDLSLFESIVASDFVNRAGPDGAATDRGELARRLRSLHATARDASLAVEALVAETDRVVAKIAVRGAGQRAFVGLPGFAGLPIWGPVDLLRIVGGRVIERWSADAPPTLLEPIAGASLGRSLPAAQVVTLDRVSLGPGDRLDAWLGDEVRFIAVETGALQVTGDAGWPSNVLVASPDPPNLPKAVRPGTDLSLGPGDLLVVPPLTRVELRGREGELASILIVTVADLEPTAGVAHRSDPAFPAVTPPSDAGSEGAGGPVIRRVAGGRVLDLPAGPMSIAFGRATLPPGAAISGESVAGAVTLIVESGTLDLTVDQRAAWVTTGATGASREIEEVALVAGDGAQVPTGTSVDLRNEGDKPLVVLIVTILLDDAPVEPAGA